MAHASIGQLRNYTGEPYIVHPIAVAELVRGVPHSPVMIHAALLHDVVEDTPVTLDEIRQRFGQEVAGMVGMLTNPSRPSDGCRALRKAIDRQHSANASPAVKTIKLADVIENTRNIVDHDPVFARTYIAEKLLLLRVLREGDPVLWNMAHQTLLSQARRIFDCRWRGMLNPGLVPGCEPGSPT